MNLNLYKRVKKLIKIAKDDPLSFDFWKSRKNITCSRLILNGKKTFDAEVQTEMENNSKILKDYKIMVQQEDNTP